MTYLLGPTAPGTGSHAVAGDKQYNTHTRGSTFENSMIMLQTGTMQTVKTEPNFIFEKNSNHSLLQGCSGYGSI
jgi:hypothetical protein